MSAVLTQLLDAAVTAIQGLSLSGITSSNISKTPVIVDRNMVKPAIRVCPYGPEGGDPAGGTNQQEQIIYNIAIAIVAAANQDVTSGTSADDYYLWRQKIRRLFSEVHTPRPFGSITEHVQTIVDPFNIVDSAPWLTANLFLSALLLKVECRESGSTS